MQSIGIFGGTFDPIHYGHLRTAFEVRNKLSLDEVRFIPCSDPPHRPSPMTDSALRLRMVQAAIRAQQGFIVDDRELKRSGPSYSVDTLTSLRVDYPHQSLCLIMGMDAFVDLPTWYQWPKLLDLAHIVVAHRPGWLAPEHGVLGQLIQSRGTVRPEDLRQSSCGRIHVEEVTQLEISSTDLRAAIAAGLEPEYLMPDSVWKIILETGCYAKEEAQANA